MGEDLKNFKEFRKRSEQGAFRYGSQKISDFLIAWGHPKNPQKFHLHHFLGQFLQAFHLGRRKPSSP